MIAYGVYDDQGSLDLSNLEAFKVEDPDLTPPNPDDTTDDNNATDDGS